MTELAGYGDVSIQCYEQAAEGGCVHFSYQLVAFAFLLRLQLFRIVGDNVLLEASVALADDALGCRKLARPLLYTHLVGGLSSSTVI